MTSKQEGEISAPILEEQKRGRGRPRKHPAAPESTVKRGRGRPRKYSIVEKETTKEGVLKPVFKKVDSGYLVKHFLNYFTKLLVLHHELSKDMGKQAPIFARLKNLDFQMVEVCKTLLTNEYKVEGAENNPVETLQELKIESEKKEEKKEEQEDLEDEIESDDDDESEGEDDTEEDESFS